MTNLMNHRCVGVLTLSMALFIPAWGYAAGTVDPLRCEAKQLRCDSDLYQCLARCDRVAARRDARSTDSDAGNDDRCGTACYDRRQAAEDRMQAKPPCAAVSVEPDPGHCEAMLLRKDAAFMLCQSRCGRRAEQHSGFDWSACEDACTMRHDEDRQQILSSPVCAAGPMTLGESQ
jgi:hypothetical protein